MPLQVVLQQNVLDHCHHKLDVFRVCGASHVPIHVAAGRVAIEGQKAALDVLLRLLVVIAAGIVRKCYVEVDVLDFFLEEVALLY